MALSQPTARWKDISLDRALALTSLSHFQILPKRDKYPAKILQIYNYRNFFVMNQKKIRAKYRVGGRLSLTPSSR